jgi:hypothetical protein
LRFSTAWPEAPFVCCSEIDIKDHAIAELQTRVQAVELDAGMRVANLQDSFLLKLENLKASHQESITVSIGH